MLSSRKFAVARYRRSTGEYNEENEHLLQMYKKYKPIKQELFTDYYYTFLRKNSMHTPQLKSLLMQAEEVGLMKIWEDQVRFIIVIRTTIIYR